MNFYRLQRYTNTDEVNALVAAKSEKEAVALVAAKTKTSENDWEVLMDFDTSSPNVCLTWKRSR